MTLAASLLLLGFGVGFTVANLLHWRLLKRVMSLRAEMAAINAVLTHVQVEHARIEQALIAARHEAYGLDPPVRQ